jgi:pyruvate,water dikinase
MARAARALLTALEQDAEAPGTVPLHGLGIGTVPYVGRARVATSADDAIDRLEVGDVLVAPFTGPAYNTLLPLLGALVVDHGGPMCHAAIAAREFGIPAVIGAADASRTIPDGSEVEVDPVTGTVRIVA